MSDFGKPLTGRKVLVIILAGFAIIIAANLSLAVSAIATNPGSGGQERLHREPEVRAAARTSGQPGVEGVRAVRGRLSRR